MIKKSSVQTYQNRKQRLPHTNKNLTGNANEALANRIFRSLLTPRHLPPCVFGVKSLFVASLHQLNQSIGNLLDLEVR